MHRLIAVSLFLLGTAALSAQTTVLTHVNLADGAGLHQDFTIVIQGAKIRDVGPSSSVKAPAGAEVVDLSGKYVVPGIINLHGHVGNVKGLEQDRKYFTRENVEKALATYGMYGVTTTTSMGTDEDSMVEFRDARNRGAFGGARVVTALQGFTMRGGYPTQAPGVKGVAQEVSTAAQAEAWVDQLADKGADIVKMWVDGHHGQFEKLPSNVYSAIIKQAHKRKLLTLAHVYDLADAKGLARAGIDILGHSVRDQEVDDELVSLLKKNGVYYVPTLTREKSTYIYSESPAWLDDPFFKKGTDAETIAGVKTQLKQAQSDPAVIEQGKKDFEMAARNLKKLVDAGVKVSFGTDTGPPGRFAGYFEHWEAELMVGAGVSPARVIEGWSTISAQALRIDKDFGAVAKGKNADFIVLNGNPLENILNTRKIHAVYIDGKVFP